MTIAENVVMSDMARRRVASLVPRAMMRAEARAALERLGMDSLDPDTRVSRLSVAEMQLVEIARAVRQRARLLVLDEPNSARHARAWGDLAARHQAARDERVSALRRFRAEIGAKSFPALAECADAPVAKVEAFCARLAAHDGTPSLDSTLAPIIVVTETAEVGYVEESEKIMRAKRVRTKDYSC